MTPDSVLFLASIALGFGIGLCYEGIRFWRLALPHRSFLIFAEDLLICSAGTVAFLFFTFAFSDGVVRWFSLAGTGCGLWLYFQSLGRLLSAVSQTVLNLLRAGLRLGYRILVLPLCIVFKKITNWILSRIKSLGIIILERERRRFIKRAKKKALSLAENGFFAAD